MSNVKLEVKDQKLIKIIVNSVSIRNGGGVQACISFIEYVVKRQPGQFQFKFLVSSEVASMLKQDQVANIDVIVIHGNLANPFYGHRVREKVRNYYSEFQPDLVYSIGFPSYVAAPCPEIGRYTNPWEIFDLPHAWRLLSITEKMERFLKILYRRHWARSAGYFETQTEEAKVGIVNKLEVAPEKVFVSSNCLSARFANYLDSSALDQRDSDLSRVFCFAAEHRHKNLSMVVPVASLLKHKHMIDAKFVLTLNTRSDVWIEIKNLAERYSVQDMIINLGPLDLDEAVKQYQMAGCLFLPTLAEVFSATYIEAMAMQVPVVTTNLPFATEICKNAALYFDPNLPTEAATQLATVIQSVGVRSGLIAKGLEVVRALPSQEVKNSQLLEWMGRICSSNGNEKNFSV